MIKKLKIKFILTNMLLITVVIIASFTVLYFNTANTLEANSVNAMKDIARSDKSPADGLFDKNNNSRNKYPNVSAYILDIDFKRNTCHIEGLGDVDNLTQDNVEYVNELIDLVNKSKSDEGIIERYNMRFCRSKKPYGTRIVLLSKDYEDSTLKQTMLSYFSIGGIALLAFLGISFIIAHLAVKPVETSVKQQKQLVSDMSHELKTPITVIAANTEILLSNQELNESDNIKWIGYIKDETARMTDLVNTMLYLAKTDEADAKPTLTEVDLTTVTMEMCLPFESICFEKGKQFSFFADEDVIVLGEESSLKQLLAILVDNAIKYSNENGHIEVHLKKQSEKAVLSVYNTGEPIPKEHMPYIFERFYRADKARSRANGGSGLGLSIAKRIIENNNACISVTSNQANGTIFICEFKLIKAKKIK